MKCGRSHLLEALVAGELSWSGEAELKQHAKGCARCRHELNWLETEQGLFRQRAGRDEVTHLWKGVAQRSGIAAPRAWPKVLAALAVTASLGLLLAVGVRYGAGARSPGELGELESAPAQSESIMSVGGVSLAPSEGAPACSTLPQGLGFHCGPVEEASFLASRY